MTIRQLAEILGLSKSTVGYALRGSRMVSAETQEFVQRRARELGYTPNPVASAFLHQVRSQGSERYQANLAFLIRTHSNWRDFQDAITRGAENRAKELGYSLDYIDATKSNSKQLTRLLQARGVLGVIVGPQKPAFGHLTLDWSKFACVTFGYSMTRPEIHRVVPHHAEGVRVAFRMCRHRGYRRIGLIIPDESDKRSNRQWSSTYLGLQQTLKASERVSPFLVPGAQFTYEKVRAWVLKEKVEAIIAHSAHVIPDRERMFSSFPRKVACVVLGRAPNDPLAGIDERFDLCGKLLIELLSSLILHNQPGIPETPVISMVNGIWVDHPSFAQERKA